MLLLQQVIVPGCAAHAGRRPLDQNADAVVLAHRRARHMLVAFDEAAPELPFVPGEIARGNRLAGLCRRCVPAWGGIGGRCLPEWQAGVLAVPEDAGRGKIVEGGAPEGRRQQLTKLGLTSPLPRTYLA